MPSREKILVLRGGAIGDFILTLPVFAALREQFPDTHLEVLGYPHVAQLALAGGLVDKVRSIEARPLASFFARGGTLPDELRDYFSSFAIIISFLYDPDQIFQTNVASCSKAQFIAGPHRPNDAEKLHATKIFLKPLERLAIFDADPTPRLSLNTQPSALDQIAIHPGSGSERKNWPEEKWAELLALLFAETDLNVLLVGGEAEAEKLAKLSSHSLPSRIELAEKLPLPELAIRLRNCKAFVGHDSGITHLAAALDIPCFALWNETVEEVWRPMGSRVEILRHEHGIAEISVLHVAEKLKRIIS